MDRNAPIGIFDSGLGGLTALKAVRESFPNEDIVYFGDTLRVPYGNRSKETIIEYVKDDINILLRYGVKVIVVACNTADSTAKNEVSDDYDIPIIGVVEPAVKKAVETTKNKNIGIICTVATAASHAYETAIGKLDPDCNVIIEPTPLIVPLIEEGRVHKGDKVLHRVLKEYLLPLAEKGIDTLVLGCTHYPIITDNIAEILPGINLINSGSAAVEELRKVLSENDLFADRTKKGNVRYFVSDIPGSFAATASHFIEEDIADKVEKVEFDKI